MKPTPTERSQEAIGPVASRPRRLAKLVELDGEDSGWAPPQNSPKISAIASPRSRHRSVSNRPKHTKKTPKAKAPPSSAARSAVPWPTAFGTTSPELNAKAKQTGPVHHQHLANGRVKLLGFERTMGIAQKLYQNGHITYMRTDSPGLSPEVIQMARTLIDQTYGSLPSRQTRTMPPEDARGHSAHQRLGGRERSQRGERRRSEGRLDSPPFLGQPND